MDRRVVEVSDVFWHGVHQAAYQNRPVSNISLPVGARPMLTGETIALPAAYFMRRPPGVYAYSEAVCTMECEYVFEDVPAMLRAVLRMYEDAATYMQESLSQRRRRRDLHVACAGGRAGDCAKTFEGS